jgi:hypothetical protein
MVALEALFKKKGLKFDHKDNRIGCYPHIVNICVSHIVKSLKAGKSDEESEDEYEDDEAEDDDAEDESDSEDEEDFLEHGIKEADYDDLEEWFENLKRNPVNRARVVVRKVRSSGQRKDDFVSVIKTGNQKGWFKDASGEVLLVKELQLIRDVRHRWDSLYNMISRLQELRLVRPNVIYYY